MACRLGIIGAGRMTQLAHLPNLMLIGGVEVVALADVDTALAQRVADRFHIPRVYDSSAALLDGESRLDGVLIVTPRMHHAVTCLPALERGIPVFLEKPLEDTVEKAAEIARAQEKSGTLMLIGYHNRFDPAYLLAESLLRSGEFGNIRYGQIHSFGGAWMSGASLPGSISLDDAPAPVGQAPPAQSRDGRVFPPELEWVEGWIHEVNLARGLFGEARGVVFASNDVPRIALVEFERARALFEVGLIAPPGTPFDMKLAIHCRDGRIDLDFAPPLAFRQRTGISITTPQGIRLPSLDYKESFVQELVHFLRCILGREQPLTTVQDALRDVELAFEIVQAGRRQSVSHGGE